MLFRFAEVTHVDDQISEQSPVLLFARIVVGGFFIELSQQEGNTELAYIMLRLDRACVDVTLAECTVNVVAQLGSVQLIDKQNLGWLFLDCVGSFVAILDWVSC